MAQFSVNAERFDPYKNFKFRVKWDGRYVAGVSKVGGLKRTTEVVSHREGGDPSSSRKSPGRSEYEAITLERGVTHDTEFEKWANKIWNFGAGLGQEIVDPVVERLGKRGLDVTGVVRHGHAAATLCAVAEECGATHIVVGKTGASRIRAQLFGSVANSLIQISKQPVTVVP